MLQIHERNNIRLEHKHILGDIMYKNVLVAFDESDTSSLALKEAISYIKEHPQSFLRIIHVVDEFVTYLDTQPITPVELQEAIKKAGVALLQKVDLKLRSENISNYDTKLLEIDKLSDRISQKIVDEAKLWPADLIIIGTHGRRGFNHFFLGSVAEGVSRIASVPVLLIRGKNNK
jgi:nucleotide-binding universal stress UspA family protein